jgi:acetoin utilization protein AcuC
LETAAKKPILIYTDELLGYRFNSKHPFNQKRLHIVKDLLEAFGFLSSDQVMAPRLATDEEIHLIHESTYVDMVKKLSQKTTEHSNEFIMERFGIGSEDTPAFLNMHEMTSLIVGGSVLGADLIMQGKTNQVFNMAGGLHHAFQGKASGFCIYNDCSVAIAHLRKTYDVKVLYIDTDAHHGDGVQWSFYDDPDVFTFSIHETGRYLFPGTGHITERGDGKGYGYSLNIPLDAFTQDDSWLECFEEALDEVIEFFKPDIIVSQNGCDAHFYDPLTHLATSMKIYAQIPRLVQRASEKYSQGRWLAVGGGGYDIWRVVPRAWSMIWMVMNDIPIVQQSIPESWLINWGKLATKTLPKYLLDHEQDFPIIPRKPEIEEQNQYTKEKALSYLRQQKNKKC